MKTDSCTFQPLFLSYKIQINVLLAILSRLRMPMKILKINFPSPIKKIVIGVRHKKFHGNRHLRE